MAYCVPHNLIHTIDMLSHSRKAQKFSTKSESKCHKRTTFMTWSNWWTNSRQQNTFHLPCQNGIVKVFPIRVETFPKQCERGRCAVGVEKKSPSLSLPLSLFLSRFAMISDCALLSICLHVVLWCVCGRSSLEKHIYSPHVCVRAKGGSPTRLNPDVVKGARKPTEYTDKQRKIK